MHGLLALLCQLPLKCDKLLFSSFPLIGTPLLANNDVFSIEVSFGLEGGVKAFRVLAANKNSVLIREVSLGEVSFKRGITVYIFRCGLSQAFESKWLRTAFRAMLWGGRPDGLWDQVAADDGGGTWSSRPPRARLLHQKQEEGKINWKLDLKFAKGSVCPKYVCRSNLIIWTIQISHPPVNKGYTVDSMHVYIA